MFNLKKSAVFFATASLIAIMAIPSYAADTRTAVSSVKLKVVTDLSIGSTSSDVEVTTNSTL